MVTVGKLTEERLDYWIPIVNGEYGLTDKNHITKDWFMQIKDYCDFVDNDKYYFVKSGAYSIIDRILHKDLAVRSDAVYLLIAAVSGAKAGGHDHQRNLHILYLPFFAEYHKNRWYQHTRFRRILQPLRIVFSGGIDFSPFRL